MLLGLIVTACEAHAAGCLPYGPDKVTLTGKLDAEVYAGPPNYDSIEKGDLPQTAFVLVLEKPVCVSGSVDPAMNGAPVLGLVKIQLRMPDAALRKKMHPLIDQPAIVSGTLAHSASARDRAAVLIDASDIIPGPGFIADRIPKPRGPQVKKGQTK